MDAFTFPVLVYLTRRARPGHEVELLAWAQALCGDAERFEGYLDSSARGTTGADGYDVGVGIRFSSARHLLAWEQNEHRNRRVAEAGPLMDGDPVPVSLQELEAGLAGAPTDRAVPKWRTALSVWLALFPWSLLANFLLVPALLALSVPLLVVVVFSSMLTVVLVIWVTLPWVHRLLRRLWR